MQKTRKSASHNKRNREKELLVLVPADDVSNWMLKTGYHYHGLGVLSSIYLTYILTGFPFDLGFLGVEKTFLNKNHHYLSRRKKIAS